MKVRQKVMSWTSRRRVYRHMAVQLANEKTPVEALTGFRKRLERKGGEKLLISIVTNIIRRLQNGDKLSNALEGYVPPAESMVILTGDLSGNLALSFERIISTNDRISRIKNAIKGAVTTPVIQLGILYFFLYMIGSAVVPQLSSVLPIEKAHGSIYVLYVLGDFFDSWYSIVPVGVLIVAVVAIAWSLPGWIGRNRVKLEEFFPYSTYRDINGYMWLLSFSALLEVGMPEKEIIEKQSGSASPWLGERLKKILRGLNNGDSLSRSLELAKMNFPNPNIIDEIGSVDDFMDKARRMSSIATEWADEIEASVISGAKLFGYITEGALYLVLGYIMMAANDLSSQLSVAVH